MNDIDENYIDISIGDDIQSSIEDYSGIKESQDTKNFNNYEQSEHLPNSHQVTSYPSHLLNSQQVKREISGSTSDDSIESINLCSSRDHNCRLNSTVINSTQTSNSKPKNNPVTTNSRHSVDYLGNLNSNRFTADECRRLEKSQQLPKVEFKFKYSSEPLSFENYKGSYNKNEPKLRKKRARQSYKPSINSKRKKDHSYAKKNLKPRKIVNIAVIRY